MNYRWILTAVIISIVFHLVIMFFFGKVQINFPSLDFIHAYVFEKKKNIPKNPTLDQDKAPLESQKKDESPTKEQESTEETSELIDNKSEVNNSSLASQTQNESKSANIENTSSPNNFTKFLNEKMKFDIYWMGIYAGYATIKVTGSEEEIRIISEVHSAPFISNFYYVNDKAESIIYKGKPKLFYIRQIEGKYRGHKEIQFNYDSGEITFINHIKNKMSIHKGIDKTFMDVLTGFFYVRSQSINPNSSIFVDIFDSDKFGTVEIKLLKEEIIETDLMKEVKSILIKPELTTDGLFKRKGDIFIWITNDDRKIPIKVETKVSVGRVVAELKEYRKE